VLITLKVEILDKISIIQGKGKELKNILRTAPTENEMTFVPLL